MSKSKTDKAIKLAVKEPLCVHWGGVGIVQMTDWPQLLWRQVLEVFLSAPKKLADLGKVGKRRSIWGRAKPRMLVCVCVCVCVYVCVCVKKQPESEHTFPVTLETDFI